MRYVAIRSEGGLLPYDLLDKIAAEEAAGQKASDFGLPKGRRLNDEISRVWSDAQDLWDIFRRRRETLSERDPYGTTLTRDRWILPLLSDAEMLGYDLKFQPSAAVINRSTYPVSHRAGDGEAAPPVHVEGFKIDLDRRLNTKLRTSPQAMVQEYLNNSEQVLWGIVTNGTIFRILRDSSRTARPQYLEFDLETIIEGNHYNEFALFYRLCHRSRFPLPGKDASECLLEQYYQQSLDEGARVRERLRDGVEDALKILGTALLRHPKNSALRDKAAQREFWPQYHRQLLLLVYRLLFLMVAEERGLIVSIGDDAEQNQKIYDEWYSITRLREHAAHIVEESPFGDLWQGLQRTFSLFEYGVDTNPLGIPPLNGDLFDQTRAIPDLVGTQLYNHELLIAVRRLSVFKDERGSPWIRVNYSHLDVEELGSVYESLLDYQPVIQPGDCGLAFELSPGMERKRTGSYYTRPELVHELIESALVPVMQERLAKAEKETEGKDLVTEQKAKEEALLDMSVCDPACGSGHFLLAAARRLGKELARIRTGEDEPKPGEFHLAVRDVISHCIYGVDLNPLAVDLCKVALWLEGHWAGKPLSFLDHRIKLGNSLVGVLDMKVLEEGIPDEAFTPVTGDDKKVASAFKKRNKDERKGQPSLSFDTADHVHHFAAESSDLISIEEDTPADVRRKKEAYEKSRQKPDWWHDWVAANLWTTAFFSSLTKFDDPLVPTYERFMTFFRGRQVSPRLEGTAISSATYLSFFHWQLEFPGVFERGGFDVILGNPPWESIQLDEKEYFASAGAHEIASLAGARRKSAIDKLAETNPKLAASWLKRKAEVESSAKFVRESGRFPLAATGKINTYALFAELGTQLLSSKARMGLLLPTGIATDDGTKEFFGDVVSRRSLVSLVGFENEAFIFPAVHHAFKFCALTVAGHREQIDNARLIFFCRYFDDLTKPDKWFRLSSEDFLLVSPNTQTSPTFRSRIDASLGMKIYRQFPVLVRDSGNQNPWQVEYKQGLFNLTSASGLFEKSPAFGRLPLYEAKMLHQFDHRVSTYEGATRENLAAGILPQVPEESKQNLDYQVQPRYWVSEEEVAARLEGWHYRWTIGYRDITSAVTERTGIFAILPYVGVGNSVLLLLPKADTRQIPIPLVCALLGNLNSLVTDFIIRTKLTYLHLSYFVLKQIPVIPPNAYRQEDWRYIVPRVLELTFVSNDLCPFAADVWNGSNEELREAIRNQSLESGARGVNQSDTILPFRWDGERRARIRAELDAYYAHLHHLSRNEIRYILDPKDVFGEDFPSETFRVLKEREEKERGEYRTQKLVLEAYDKLAESPRFHDEMASRVSSLNSLATAGERR